MQAINRRRALTVVATAPIAIAASPGFAAGEPGELAALVRQYFKQVAAFNKTSVGDYRTDEQNDALAEATYEATQERMIGVPARTAEDALAALDWLIKEGVDFEIDYSDEPDGRHEEVVVSLVTAIRSYIEGRIA